MSKSIMYTTDGKKVVVIGNLSDNTKIVQEIYITEDGQEIPSGNSFTCNILHNQKVVSWKEKNLKELETKYEERKKQLEESQNKLVIEQKKLKERLNQVISISKNVKKEDFDLIIDYLTGKITHVVFDSYSSPQIVDINDDFMFANCSGYDQRLKLLTICGDNGNLSYKISHYSDGSGGTKTVYPAYSKDHAIQICQKLFDEYISKIDPLSNESISYEKWESVGVNIPEWVKKRNLKLQLMKATEQLDILKSTIKNKEEEINYLQKGIAPPNKKSLQFDSLDI